MSNLNSGRVPLYGLQNRKKNENSTSLNLKSSSKASDLSGKYI